MASAGTVTVDFAAETARFTADLRKVNDSLKGMGDGFSTVAKLARNFLPVVSAGAVLAFAKSSFEAADALGDTAKVIGVNVEALSRLKFAAEQNDIEFSTLSTSLTRYQKNLSEANAGNRTAVSLFDSLGLSASALRSLKLEDQIGLIADQFKLIKDPADQTRIAMELFGKTGAQLKPLLDQGSEGIRQLALEADNLGVTLSITTAAGIDALDSAWKRFKATTGGSAANLLGSIGLAIFGSDDALVNMKSQIEDLTRLKESLLAAQGPNARDPNSGLAIELKRVNDELDAATTRFRDLERLRNGGGSFGPPRRTGGTVGPSLGEFQITGAAAAGKEEQSGWQVVAEANAEFQRSMLETSRNIAVESLEESSKLALETQRELGTKVNQEIEDQLQQEAALRASYAQQQYQREVNYENTIRTLKASTLSNVLGGLQAFAGQSKKVAIAIVAIQKAQALAQAVQLGFVAIAQAAASAPPPYNLPAIAWAKGLMALNIAGIAASGIGQIASINSSSGPGAPLGAPVNPVFTDSGTNAAGQDDRTFGAQSQSVAQVIVQGSVFSGRETADWLLETIRDAVDGRDVVIISPGSQQAAMLGAA